MTDRSVPLDRLANEWLEASRHPNPDRADPYGDPPDKDYDNDGDD